MDGEILYVLAGQGDSRKYRATSPCPALLELGQALGDGVEFLLWVQKALLQHWHSQLSEGEFPVHRNMNISHSIPPNNFR